MATVGVEWINNFPDPCDQNELSYCDDTSVGFLNGMTSRGHTASFNWGDGNAWEQDFRDPAFGGDDTNWVDNVDFAHFMYVHGSASIPDDEFEVKGTYKKTVGAGGMFVR